MTKAKKEEWITKIKYEKTKAEAVERVTHAYSKLVIVIGTILILIALILVR